MKTINIIWYSSPWTNSELYWVITEKWTKKCYSIRFISNTSLSFLYCNLLLLHGQYANITWLKSPDRALQCHEWKSIWNMMWPQTMHFKGISSPYVGKDLMRCWGRGSKLTVHVLCTDTADGREAMSIDSEPEITEGVTVWPAVPQCSGWCQDTLCGGSKKKQKTDGYCAIKWLQLWAVWMMWSVMVLHLRSFLVFCFKVSQQQDNWIKEFWAKSDGLNVSEHPHSSDWVFSSKGESERERHDFWLGFHHNRHYVNVHLSWVRGFWYVTWI